MASDGVTPDPRPADGADPTRCGCAGKTPLDRVVLPAREAITRRLDGTGASLGPDCDAAVLPGTTRLVREVDEGSLDGTPAVPFESTTESSSDRPERDADSPVVTLACALLGDDLADATALGTALGEAYAALAPSDGSPVTVGKGHAVQIPDATGGRLWLEHLRVTASDDRDAGDGNESDAEQSERFLAANVDAVHAFPGLAPSDQARIAVSNALADVYAVGATTDRAVRPVVWAPESAAPSTASVAEWYRTGAPADARLLDASVSTHDGTGWVLGATVTAVGDGDGAEHRLPADCGVLLTRPPGALAAFALGATHDDDRLRERGRRHLLRDGRPIAEVLASFRPGPAETFDPTEHVARVTDVSGEGIAGVGRLAATVGRTLRLDRLPVLAATAVAAADGWTVPDVTVETNGPFAVFATPTVLGRVAADLVDVDGADPRQIGTLDDPNGEEKPIVDATGRDLSQVVEAAARWPRASLRDDTAGSDGEREER